MTTTMMRSPGGWWARTLPLLLLVQVPACAGGDGGRDEDRAGGSTGARELEGEGDLVLPPELVGLGEWTPEEVVIDPQEHATDLPVPTGTSMVVPPVDWLTRLFEEIEDGGGRPALRFDDARAGELLNVRVAVRPEMIALDELGRETAAVDLGALAVRVTHELAAGVAEAQLLAPEGLPLDQALVLKTYTRPRIAGELGPVSLAMVSLFDRRDEAAGPVATLDVSVGTKVNLALDCDAVAYEIAGEVPPIAVSFPKLSGCTLLECGKAKAAWLRGTHDLYRIKQMLDYIASAPAHERAFLWAQEAANKKGEALHSYEDPEVGPNTALAYYFGPYTPYRFDAIRWAFNRIWADFHDHELEGLELDIECTPEPIGDLCNSHKPAGHHAVKSNVKLCEKAFKSPFEVFDVPRLVIHETMHHLYVPWNDKTPRLSPIMDTHTHGHGGTCLANLTTDKGYGLENLRHLSTYLNAGGGDCYHTNFAFRNNDSYAYAAATIGTYVRFGLIHTWPLHHPPKQEPFVPELACGQVGLDPPPPGFADPLAKCEKLGGELVCPGYGGGGGQVQLPDFDLAIVCPEY